MNKVDNRVVKMQFDNEQFESGVSTTVNSLEKLKSGLKLDDSAKSLTNLENAGKNFSLSGIASGVDAIAGKFSTLGIMGITAIQNITNSAVNAGKKIASAFTIDPIKTGFQEYETQINAVQTILANTESKGSTLNQVNAALAELNTYADKTIYNFTEMTRNIGTFTAAGVDLNTSVQAVKGIANLAAVSGSNAQQASTAMYQLSQALASGTVKLMDWNSVVNAGMGGQVFQDALKETARVHGIAIDDMIESEGSFRETLQKGWLTSDILTETLNKFTGDMSEAQLKELGYTDEQIAQIVKLGKTANDAATKVKTFSQLFDTLKEAAQSGWTQSWQTIIGDFGEAKSLLTEMSDVLGNLIGESSKERNDLLTGGLASGWKQLLSQGIADEAGYVDAIKKVADQHGVSVDSMIDDQTSFTDTLKSGWLTSDMMTEALSNMTDEIGSMSDEQLKNCGYTNEQVASLKELNDKVQNGSISMDDFAKKMVKASGRENLIDAMRNSFEALMTVLKPIKEAFREVFPPATAEQLYDLTVKIKDFTEDLIANESTVSKIKSTFKGFFSILDLGKQAVSAIAGGIYELAASFFNSGDSILNATSNLGTFITKIDESAKKIDIFKKTIQKVADFIGGVFSHLGGIAGTIKTIISAIASGIEKIAKVLSSGLTTDSMNSIFTIIDGSLFSVFLMNLDKFSGGLNNFVKTLMKSVGEEGPLSGIKGILDSVKGCLESWQKSLDATTLLKIAVAVTLLARSLTMLAMISPERLMSALSGITTLFTELMASLEILTLIVDQKKLKSLNKVTGVMIGMAISILILASAVKMLADLSWDELAKGLLGVTILMGVLIAAVKLLSKDSGNIQKIASGLITFSIALVILSSAVKILGGMDIGSLSKGLGAVAILLGEIALFMKVTEKNSLKNAGSILIFSVALTILAAALKIYASMSLAELGTGLLGLAVSLGIIAGAMALMQNGVKGAAAMLLMSNALAIFIPMLMLLSTLSLSDIGIALLALAGAFGVLGLAGVVLGPLVPVLVGLGGAIALIGVGILAAATGITLFSAALIALSVAGTGVTVMMSVLIQTIINFIPLIMVQIANGIIQFALTIANGATDITNATVALIGALLNAIITCIPKIVDAGLQLLLAILQGISDNIQKVVETALEIVANFLEGVANALPDVIQSGVDLILSFLNGIANAIRDNTKAMTDAMWNLITAMIECAFGIITGSFSHIFGLGKDLIENNFIRGIADKISGVWNTIKEGIRDALDGIGDFWQDFKDAGKNIIDGLVSGIKEVASDVANAAKDVASAAVNGVKNFLGIHSPSTVFAEIGKYSDKGFAEGLSKYGKLASNAAEDVGDDTLQTLRNTMSNLPRFLTDGIDSNPVITPVLDLSDVTAGAKTINGILKNSQSISMANVAGSESASRNFEKSPVSISMTINGAPGQDVNQLADVVINKITTSMGRRENAWR